MTKGKDKKTNIFQMFAGFLGFVLSAVCILGFIVAGFAIDYIDERIEDDCDSATGHIGQVIGADEGQCDEGSAARDFIAIIQYPLLIFGIIFGLFGAKLF